jgi:rhodanese-related sulfurtransferase
MITQIDASTLSQSRAGGSPMVMIDVREPWEFERAHIDGSINIPMSTLPARVPDVMSLKNDSGDASSLVVICHHGTRSMYCAQFLAARGVSDLVNLRGGIDAWSQTVDPSVPRY